MLVKNLGNIMTMNRYAKFWVLNMAYFTPINHMPQHHYMIFVYMEVNFVIWYI
jgi:hypothetical protein